MSDLPAQVHVSIENQREVFVGPRPFERSEKNLFFGRDAEIEELLSLVTSHRIVLCYAPSGAGKTSLINAGLHPQLEAEGFQVLPPTRVKGPNPEGVHESEITNIYVFNAILGLVTDTASPPNFVGQTISQYLATLPHLTDQENYSSLRILIFDQFEELITSYLERWQEREGFFKQVGDALRADPLLRILFVMREDYLARVEPFMRSLKTLSQARFRLDLLGPRGAKAAVIGPLRDTYRRFKEGVVDTLVEELLKVRVESTQGEAAEVVGEYVEPVQLQVVCRNLWNSLPEDVQEINHEHVKAYGDVDQALRDFYESCLTGARTGLRANESGLRHWFESKLITPAGTRSIVFRDTKKTAGLSNAVVDFLENRHIIRGEWRAGSRWYELTHDRLIEPIQRANERWRTEQRQASTSRMLYITAGTVLLLLIFSASFVRLQQPFSSAPPAVYTQSQSTVVAVQTVAQEQVDVAQEQVAAAQENAAISQSRQLAAQALFTDDPELARLLAVQANQFYDTAAARRSLHKVLSEQGRIDDKFLREFDPEVVSPKLSTRMNYPDKKWVISVAFSPDGRRFVSGGQDAIMILWDLSTATEALPPFSGHRSNIQQVTYSPDGKMIASAALDAQVLLWDASNGEPIGDPLLGHEGLITAVAFSPDGTQLASGGQDGTIRIWDLETRESKVLLQPAEVWDVAWSPDGKTLAAASAGNWVRLYETETFNEFRVLQGANGLVRTIAWSPDGRTLAAGAVLANQSGDPIGGDVLTWDVDSLRVLVRPLPQNIQPVRSVTFDPTGKTLAIGRDDGTIALWDVRSRKLLSNPFRAHDHRVMSIAFSPDGQYMVSGSIDGTIGLWNLLAPTRSIAVNSKGDLLATSQGPVISLWDLSASQTDPVQLFTGHTDDILSLAFSPDGKTLVSSGKDQTIRFWDVDLGQQVGPTDNPRSNVPTLQFSPDGSMVAIAGESGRIQLLDPNTRETLPLPGLDGPAIKVQFGADGKTLDAVSRNGTLVTIDLSSTKPRILQESLLASARGGLSSIALSPDGQNVAYFQEGGTRDVAVLANDSRAHGIALSYWDQSFDPNVNRDDVDFIIIKATEGTQFVDRKFEEYVRMTQLVPMRGAFHFFRENEPWKEQADHFLSTVKDNGFHFYILDLEVRPKDGSTDFLADAEQWLKYVDEQVEGQVLLEAGSFSNLTEFGAAGEWMKDWPLMVIQYPSTPDRNGNPSLPQGFTDWKIWNYTEDGSGAEYGVGTDRIYLVVYNGTPAEMGQWLGVNAFSIMDRSSQEVINPKETIQVTSPNGLAFSADGSYLAAAGEHTVALLDAATGDAISSLSVSGEPLSLNFTPNSNVLVIGTDYGTVLLWELSLLRPGTEIEPILAVACAEVLENLSQSDWAQYVGVDVPYDITCSNALVP